MMRSLTLGRVRGIDLKIHPSLALIVLWVFYHWGRQGSIAALLFGLTLVALVFACVVLHEFGHSFMAMHYGVRVHDITLFPFGGVARIEQVPARPTSEMMVAIAGPAVNIAIMTALLPPLFLLGIVAGWSSPGELFAYLNHISPAGLLVYLFLTNLLLVLFNLLPAFPMDGGRVLRAVLSLGLGREQGTRIAVVVGQVFAVLLAIFGIWIGDFVLPLVAVAIIFVGRAEGRSVQLESAMQRLRVGQFALWDMGGISPDCPLTYALRGGPRDIVVTDRGWVVGMLWRNQLLSALHGGVSGRTVADIMDSSVMAVSVDTSVYDVQQQMNELNRWAVPVTDETGFYRGIFTADRFVHVYRQITAKPALGRTAASFADSIGGLVRSWTR